jgi:hypothetical protein
VEERSRRHVDRRVAARLVICQPARAGHGLKTDENRLIFTKTDKTDSVRFCRLTKTDRLNLKFLKF